MSYSSEHIQIMDMRFSAHVTVAEFEQWLSQVERFFLKKQHFVLVMQTDIGTEFPEEYRQLQAAWYKKYKQLFSILLGSGSNCTRPNRPTTTEYTFAACCMAGALLRHT